MKIFLLYCFLLVGSCLTLKAQERQAVLNVLENQRQAWNSGNLEGFMNGYWKSDSLLFVGKTAPVRGWQTTLDNYKKNYPDKAAMGYLIFDILQVNILDPKNGFVLGGVAPETGKRRTRRLFHVVVQEDQRGVEDCLRPYELRLIRQLIFANQVIINLLICIMNKSFHVLSLFFLVLISQAARAQETSAPMKYYDRVQHIRDKASDLWGKQNPTPAEVKKSINMLNASVKLLDSIPVTDLADGNIYLKGRRHDVYMDLASAYAVSNQKDSAFAYLEKMYGEGSFSQGVLSYMAKDSSFINLRADSRYTGIINKLKGAGNLYNNDSFRTPYKTDLTEVEKQAGLALLWSEAKYNFVYFDHLKADWNQTYIDYISKVRNTKNTAEYYKVLTSFYAQLHDGHTNVYYPDSLADKIYSRPPFRTELIEGRVFVTQVFNDSLLKMGVKPGLEILKIDGEPVISYAEKNVKPYQSSSTSQDLEIRTFTYALLSGPATQPINFQFKEKSGKIHDLIIGRSGYTHTTGLKTLDYKTIGNVGYLIINDFEHHDIVKEFDSLYTEIAKTKGLIIDLRYNGGGDDGIAFDIISRLTNRSFKTSASKTLRFSSRPYNEPIWDNNAPGVWNANGKVYYNKPVIVLIGSRTFSAAEDFTVVFDYMKRGKLVGLPTGGSTGQPVPFALPGGGSARVCGKRDTYPDGKEFVGIGIMPDIKAQKTIKDLFDGTDAAKNKALKLLEN